MQTATELARRHIGDELYRVMMGLPGPQRALLILRALPPETGVGPGAAREVLDADPRFAVSEGRHDVAVRAKLRGGSFNASAERVISELGKPVQARALAALFASATDRAAAYYEGLIASLLERGDVFGAVGEASLVPAGWLLTPEGDNEDDVLFYCDLDNDAELKALRAKLSDDGLRGATALDTAARIVQAAGEPIGNKALDFLVWRLHPQGFDARELLAGMLQDPRVYPLPGLRWVPGELRQAMQAALAELDKGAVSAEPAPGVDLAAMLADPLPPDHPGYFVEDDDLQMVYALLNASARPVSVAEILHEILELMPDHPSFLAAAHSLHDLLHDDPAILEMTPTTFLGPGAVPAWAKELPQLLVPLPGKPGEDVLLRTEGLRPGLADKIHDPFWEDVGDDDVTVTPDVLASEETFLTLSFHHREAGTMKLRQMDREFFAVQADCTPVQATDDQGREHACWINSEHGIILGLGDLYADQNVMPGMVLAITPGEYPGQYRFTAAGEDDTATLSEEQLARLKALGQRVPTEGLSVFAVLREVMAQYPEGTRFERMWAEVNAARRTTRLQIASLLSYYQCFRPRDSQGDSWAYAPEAVIEGAITTKEKYVITDQGDGS